MKLSMYEGGLRVPGVIRWPGHAKPGTVSNEPVVFYDVLPTLCAVAGIAPGMRPDGVSFLPILDGKSLDRPIPLHWQYDFAQGGPWHFALRRESWKLLADADRKRFALYDLSRDPSEQNDRATQHPEIVERLRAELERVRVPSAKAEKASAIR
jgi:arylsulfatase A